MSFKMYCRGKMNKIKNVNKSFIGKDLAYVYLFYFLFLCELENV